MRESFHELRTLSITLTPLSSYGGGQERIPMRYGGVLIITHGKTGSPAKLGSSAILDRANRHLLPVKMGPEDVVDRRNL